MDRLARLTDEARKFVLAVSPDDRPLKLVAATAGIPVTQPSGGGDAASGVASSREGDAGLSDD
jgi:hypothetical protein